MLVLVVGVDRVDAGKTTFSTGLVSRTGAYAYKPRAGNDFWFDHDDCLRALADGRLYGKDAARLADAEGRGRDPEALNPVHRLWQPAPGGQPGLLGRADREFVLDRIAPPGGEEPRFVRNATADCPPAVADRLDLESARTVTSTDDLDELARDLYLPAWERLAREIEAADLAVVESYGDVADPLRSLAPEAVTVVAAVEPGRVRLYRGDRFVEACETAASSPTEGALETRVADALAHLDPLEGVRLPPLGDDRRADPAAVAAAYEPAYDALLSVASGLERA